MSDNQKTIGDSSYSFGMIPPVESVRVQVAIIKIVGEPLFKMFMGVEDKGKAPSEDQQKAAGAAVISLLASGLNADDVVNLLQRVFVYVSVTPPGKQPVRVNIDEHFLGKNLDMWKVLLEALKFNYKDFFPERLFDSIAAKMKALGASN